MATWIRNGTIVDGLGNPLRRADLLLDGDAIVDVVSPGGASGSDARAIDASGQVVAPGFIDLHSHSDIALLSDPVVTGKLNQGITFELLGQDGMSVAPLTDGVAPLWRRHLSGLSGDYPVTWEWRSFDDYLARFGPTAANVASLVGHGTIRLNVLGMADRPATDREIEQMCDLLRDALRAGALGLSGGLVYSPGSYADLRELIALNRVVAEEGKIWVVHIRFEGTRIAGALDEMFNLVEATGVPLHISHFKVIGRKNWGRGPDIVDQIERARQRGLDVTVDQYPYEAASTMLAAILPAWAHADGPDRLRQHLSDPATCERMLRDIETELPNWEGFVASAGWENIRIVDIGNGLYPGLIGQSLTAIAGEWDCAPFDAAVRLLLEADFAVGMVMFMMHEPDIETILRAPWRMGGTDALLGGKPHPRAFGSFPRVLGRYVRERKVLSLEEAVRQITSAPANRLRLTDRGTIAPGMKADLVVFDPDRVIDRATFENPTELPDGIAWVFVNGQPVLDHREPTGALPGELIRQ